MPEIGAAEANRIIASGLLVLIWTVQLVIYPSFKHVSPERFVDWHYRYTGLITWVVAPLFLGQIAAGCWLVWDRSSTPVSPSEAAFLILCGLGWVFTFAYSVPCHRELQKGPSEAKIRRLILTNGLRTAAWSAAWICSMWL